MKLKALVTAEVIREKLQERFAEQIEFTYDGYYLDPLPSHSLQQSSLSIRI